MGTDRLMALVEAYSDLGEHRTGTDVDAATVDWFASELDALGATEISRHEYTFPKYEARWSVQVDGDRVPSLPLFYEGVGSVSTTRPVVADVPVLYGQAVPSFDAIATKARSDGTAAAVIATGGANGLLCIPNREPVAGSGLPTLCVPGALGARLPDAWVDVELDAAIVEGRSTNVVARFGDGDPARAVLLATPLSGWFHCAGERGTGIAICLEIARALTDATSVVVLGTNSHELNGFGLDQFIASSEIEAAAIFHFGANIVAGDGDGAAAPVGLTPSLRPTAWAGAEHVAEFEAALAPLGRGVHVPTDPADPSAWLGESAVWSRFGLPLVSLAGLAPLHHTPEDVPALATTDDLLTASYDAALAAAHLLVEITHPDL